MPYVSKAQAERARWMTLAEAVTHIQTRDGCDARGAAAQLRAALGDGKIWPWWGDQPLPSAQRTGPRLQLDDGPSDRPGQGPVYWQTARIRGAKVFDPNDSELTSAGRALVAAGKLGSWRLMLLLRHPVEALWPAVTQELPAKRRTGRPSRIPEIDAAIKRLDKKQRRKELVSAVTKELGEGAGLSLETIRRRVRDHSSSSAA